MLDRAEELLIQFSARGAAPATAPILPTGFTHRLDEVARALSGARSGPRQGRSGAAATAGHAAAHLAGTPRTALPRHRVERSEMAARLVRWLGTADAASGRRRGRHHRQVAEWSWVDAALHHVWTGEDAHAGLQRGIG